MIALACIVGTQEGVNPADDNQPLHLHEMPQALRLVQPDDAGATAERRHGSGPEQVLRRPGQGSVGQGLVSDEPDVSRPLLEVRTADNQGQAHQLTVGLSQVRDELLRSQADSDGGREDGLGGTASARRGVEPDACPVEVFDYPWPHEEACAVSYCESRWQPWAVNGASLGLFQLWSGWARAYGLHPAELFNLSDNVRVAYFIWRDHGRWTAWSCQP